MMVIGSVEVCRVFGIVWHQSWLGTTGNDEEGGGMGLASQRGLSRGISIRLTKARSGPVERPNGGSVRRGEARDTNAPPGGNRSHRGESGSGEEKPVVQVDLWGEEESIRMEVKH